MKDKVDTFLSESQANARYEIEHEGTIFLVYDKQQDIFVDRFKQSYTEGYLTKAEAAATIKYLNTV